MTSKPKQRARKEQKQHTYFLMKVAVTLDGAECHGGRAIIVGTALPKELRPHLFATLDGDRSDLRSQFFDGDVLRILHEVYVQRAPGHTEADGARNEYQAAKKALSRLLALLPEAEARLDRAARDVVATHGRGCVVIDGERHHSGFHPKTGTVFLVPTRGGRPKASPVE